MIFMDKRRKIGAAQGLEFMRIIKHLLEWSPDPFCVKRGQGDAPPDAKHLTISLNLTHTFVNFLLKIQSPNPVLCPAIDGMETHLLHHYIPVLHELKDLQKNPRCALESCNMLDSTVGRLLEVGLLMILREFPADKSALYANRITLQAVWSVEASALLMKSKVVAQRR